MRAPNSTRRGISLSLLMVLAISSASPAAAAPDWWPEMPDFDLGWEGSTAQKATASGVDLLFVRPVATVRVVIGGLMFVPAAALSAPSGREGIDGAYETLIELPVEYAFERELGEF